MVGIKFSSARTRMRMDDWPTKVLAEALALAYVSSAAVANAEHPRALAQSAPALRQLPQAGNTRQTFDIPPQPLASALIKVARASGLRLNYSGPIVRGLRTTGVAGRYTSEQALRILLAGTGLTYRFENSGAVTLTRTASVRGETQLAPITVPSAPAAEGAELAPITVEGAGGYAGQFEVDEGFKAEYQTSATKMPVPLRETPQSVSVITQDSLEARQVTDLGQALETVPGVAQFSGPGPFGGTSPFGFQEVQIRGITVNSRYDARIDGFVGLPFYAQPDLAVFERVEVIKGPSSMLYGRSSAGGFINRVTKKPLPEFHADAELSVGLYDLYRAEGDVAGPLFDSDRARGRLVAAYEDAGSFVDGVESELGVVAPSLEFDLTDRTRVLLQGLYQEERFIPNPGFPLVPDGGDFVAPDVRRSQFFGVPNEKENRWDVLSGTAIVDHQLTDNWLASLRLNRAASDSPIDQDNYVYQYGADVALFSTEFDPNTTDVWSGEFRLEGNLEVLDRPATVGFGVDHNEIETDRIDRTARLDDPEAPEDVNIYEDNFSDFPTVEPTEISSDLLSEQKNTGVYAQFLFRPLERLGVHLGGRYDWADTSSERRFVNPSTDEQTDQEFSGRIGLTFDVLDDVTSYALYAESFTPVTATAAGGSVLGPETGKIYEAGVKTEWLENRLGVNAAVFRIDRDDIPIAAAVPPGEESFSVPGGLQRSDGVELEVNGEPLPGWNLTFGGILLDSDFVNGDFEGTTPAGAADWQAGLYTSYELQEGVLQGLGLGAGVYAIDDRGVSPFAAGGAIPGYERVDLSAFYNGFDPFKIGLQVRNVFDERYIEGAERAGAYAQFGAPTAALLTVEYEFGSGDDLPEEVYPVNANSPR